MNIYSSLLLLQAAISTATSQPASNSTNVTTGKVVLENQPATQQPPTSQQLSESQDLNTATATRVDSRTAEEARSSAAPLQQTPSTSPATLPMKIQTEPAVTSPPAATTEPSRLWKSVTMVLTSQSSNQANSLTEPTAAPTSPVSNRVNGSVEPTAAPTSPMSNRVNGSVEPVTPSNITQSLDTGRTSTFQTRLRKTTSSLTSTSKFTTEIPPFRPKSTISAGAQSSTAEKPAVTSINKAIKNDLHHGKVVAAVIGAALSLMVLGFLLIFFYKQRLRKKQEPTAWAGPSPFLEGEANNGNVELRSSNRISLASFLPQRLSKRFSLLPDTTEMKEIIPRDTFEGKHQGSTFGQTTDGNEGQEKTYKAAAEIKSGEEAEEKVVMTVIQTSV